jgi:hypothetical protein
MIRVGRRVYKRDGSYKDPKYDGFKSIICLTKSTKYGSLGPYVLKDDKGRIMENLYQFARVYRRVPRSIQYYSRYNNTVIWGHPAETHVDIDENGEEKPNQKYWEWRKKGMNNEWHVRYPVGYGNQHGNVLYALYENDGIMEGPFDYIQARKHIYVPIYTRLVKKEKQYQDLKQMLENGENLLIIEVDGPHQESLGYYRTKYQNKVNNKFIENSTMLINQQNIDIMLNDTRHPYGHGYCLASALLGLDQGEKDHIKNGGAGA